MLSGKQSGYTLPTGGYRGVFLGGGAKTGITFLASAARSENMRARRSCLSGVLGVQTLLNVDFS